MGRHRGFSRWGIQHVRYHAPARAGQPRLGNIAGITRLDISRLRDDCGYVPAKARRLERPNRQLVTPFSRSAYESARRFETLLRGAAIVMQSAPLAQWPEDAPVRLSKAQLKPRLVALLDPASVVGDFDGIARSAWPNSTQVIHYLVDCQGANRDDTNAMCEIANSVIAAVHQDEDIQSRWDFLTACGLIVRLGVYQDPGIDCLSLQIVRNPEGEAKLRASLIKS